MIQHTAVVFLLMLAATAPSVAQPADFSGTWHLVEQETRAPRRRGYIGNFNEPVVIVQTATAITIAVQSDDPTARFQYELSGTPSHGRLGAEGPNAVSASRWDGAKLVTRGQRRFTTTDGPDVFEFEETRRLSSDGRRMIVDTRIKMFLGDLVRHSVYERTR